MSQHDGYIADQQGGPFLDELNQALAAQRSQNSGDTAPTPTVGYLFWADTANDMMKMRNSANNGWIDLWRLSTAGMPSVQKQTATAFTTTGTSTAYLLTPLPAIPANSAGLRFRVSFHTPPGANPTMAVSGQAALPLKYKDKDGVKQVVTSVQIPANWSGDVECDGTDWLLLTPAMLAAADLLAVLKTVDGSGSGLDADLFRGHALSEFAMIGVTAGANKNFSWEQVYSDGAHSFTVDLLANWGYGIYYITSAYNGTTYFSGVVIVTGAGRWDATFSIAQNADNFVASPARYVSLSGNNYAGPTYIYKLKKDA